MEDRVTVAVRVRPWLGTDRGARRCSIAVDGNAAELFDPQNGGRRAQFCFDHCFDSLATPDAQADQEIVFDTLAGRLLTSAADGYNVTVFAYGQTGSGKSYTMTGSSSAPGFTPRFVSALCANCEAAHHANPRSEYAIEVSYLEIYNEAIRDLLLPIRSGKGGKGGKGASLRVREHPRTGPYVEDLSKIACNTAAQVSTLLEHGNSARAVRATNMNAASSRSHAIFSIRLTQRQPIDADADEDAAPTAGTPSRASTIERVSKVHLVDLAGSERAKRTGAAAARGVQLSEAGAINSSLATLGAVISALAAAGRRGTTHVPYRESVLTFLLRDGLGGNARTLMLATVSPAAVDFQETWSTLRYADSAKRIVNEARPNLDPTQTLVLQLRDEIDELRTALRRASGVGGGPADVAAMAAVREELGVSEKLMAEATETWEMKLRRAAALAEERVGAIEDQMAVLARQLAASEQARWQSEADRQRLEALLRARGGMHDAARGVGNNGSGGGGNKSGRANGHPGGGEPWPGAASSDPSINEAGDAMPPEFAELEAAHHRSVLGATPPLVAMPKPSEVWYAVPDPQAPSDKYYWNPATGDTTWELPLHALVFATASADRLPVTSSHAMS